MATPIFGFPQKNVELIGGPLGTKYSVIMIDHDWNTTEANLAAAMWGVGAGVIKYPGATSFAVTAGAGLTLNIAAGRAIVVHSTTGPSGIISNSTIVLNTSTGVTASTTKNLFLTQESSVKDGRPGFLWTDSATTIVDGADYIAQVVAGASTITSVTMNPDRFAELKIHNYPEDTTPDPTDEILLWDSATGELRKATLANVLASNGGVTGPASSVSGNIPSFGSNTGKALVDSGFTIDNLGGPRLITQASHGFAVGDYVYLSGSNTYAKAKADALATTNAVGRVISVPTTGTFVVARNGYMTGLSSLIAGTLYYLSTAIAGTMTATMPATLGQFIRPVFYADTTTSGYILDRSATPALITTDQIATGGQISKEQLEYIAVTDVASGLAVAAATWVDVIPSQTFSVERADNRQVNVWPSGNIQIATADATGGSFSARLLFDSATTATPLPLGGDYVNASRPANILTGAGAPRITGLGVGSHTVKLQVKCEVASTVYLRAATKPDYENFRLRVVEGKR